MPDYQSCALRYPLRLKQFAQATVENNPPHVKPRFRAGEEREGRQGPAFCAAKVPWTNMRTNMKRSCLAAFHKAPPLSPQAQAHVFLLCACFQPTCFECCGRISTLLSSRLRREGKARIPDSAKQQNAAQTAPVPAERVEGATFLSQCSDIHRSETQIPRFCHAVWRKSYTMHNVTNTLRS